MAKKKPRADAEIPKSPGLVEAPRPVPPDGEPLGATGCELGVRRVEGKNGGSLTPHPPGSNGGVHRGRDRFPRNAVRALLVNAMGAERRRPTIDPLTGKLARDAEGKILLVDVPPGKMLDDAAVADQLIVERASFGFDPEVFLRLQRDTHDILQETKAEEARGEARRPIASKFVLANGDEIVPGQPIPPQKKPEPSAGVTKDGETYLDPDS